MLIGKYSVLVANAALVGSLLTAGSVRAVAQERDSFEPDPAGRRHLNREAADRVIDWSRYAEQAIGQAAQERGQPELRVLATAMVQGAVYDAVNAIARTHQPYLVAAPAYRWYSKDAAAVTAAYRTSIALVPEQQSALEPLYQQSIAAIPDGVGKAGGIRVGEQPAEAMLAARENGGRDGPSRVVIGTEPGEWRSTPPDFAIDPASWMADVKPFLIPSPDCCAPAAPTCSPAGRTRILTTPRDTLAGAARLSACSRTSSAPTESRSAPPAPAPARPGASPASLRRSRR
jgi:hypothetical protein